MTPADTLLLAVTGAAILGSLLALLMFAPRRRALDQWHRDHHRAPARRLYDKTEPTDLWS